MTIFRRKKGERGFGKCVGVVGCDFLSSLFKKRGGGGGKSVVEREFCDRDWRAPESSPAADRFQSGGRQDSTGTDLTKPRPVAPRT